MSKSSITLPNTLSAVILKPLDESESSKAANFEKIDINNLIIKL